MQISISIKQKKEAYFLTVNFGVSLSKLKKLDVNRYVTIKRKGQKYSFEFHSECVENSVKTVVKAGAYVATFDQSILHFKPEKEVIRKVEYDDGIVISKEIMTEDINLKRIKSASDKKRAGFDENTAWARKFENEIKDEILNRIERAMRVKYE